jgi:hypothetical protein
MAMRDARWPSAKQMSKGEEDLYTSSLTKCDKHAIICIEKIYIIEAYASLAVRGRRS